MEYNSLGHANLVKGIADAMYYHSDHDQWTKELVALLTDVDVVAALVKVSGFDEESEVVAQVANA